MMKCAVGVVVLVVWAQSATAGEIFVCEDGRTLEVTSANREKLRNDPCVAEWFKRNGSKNAPAAAKSADNSKKMSNDKWTTPDYSHYYYSWRSDPSISYHTYDMPSW